VTIHPGVGPSPFIVGSLLAGQQHHLDLRSRCLDLLAQIVAAGGSEMAIDNCNLNTARTDGPQRCVCRTNNGRIVCVASEGDFEHLSHGLAVIDGEQLGSHQCLPDYWIENRKKSSGCLQKLSRKSQETLFLILMSACASPVILKLTLA
jgi:hypothetical protein